VIKDTLELSRYLIVNRLFFGHQKRPKIHQSDYYNIYIYSLLDPVHYVCMRGTLLFPFLYRTGSYLSLGGCVDFVL